MVDMPEGISESSVKRFVASDYIPTKEEWGNEIWASFKTFKLKPGSDSGRHEVFARYEFVYLRQPEDGRSNKKIKGQKAKKKFDPWIGRITAIKAVAATNICISIQWVYCSHAQLLETGLKKRDLPVLSGNEVVMGMRNNEFEDLQSHASVSDHARVIEYNEQDPLQSMIEFDDYFYRSRLMYASSRGSESKIEKGKRKAGADFSRLVVEPFKAPTCTCEGPYRPLPLSSETAMIFCPRDNCHRWYHLSCLDPPKAATVESQFELIMSRYDPATRPKKTRHADKKAKLQSEGEAEATPLATTDVAVANPLTPDATPQPPVPDDHLPADVIRYASCHIIRGDSETGIAGNGGPVLGARAIIAADIESREGLLDEWLARYGPGESGENWDGIDLNSPVLPLRQIKPSASDRVYECPHCKDVM